MAVGGGGGYERVVQCRVVGSLQNCVLVSLTQLWGRQDVEHSLQETEVFYTMVFNSYVYYGQ